MARVAPLPGGGKSLAGQSLTDLEWDKAIAVSEEDYGRASQLKQLIDDRQFEIKNLEADKARAVATEDFGRAEALKNRISLLRDGGAAAASRVSGPGGSANNATQQGPSSAAGGGAGILCCGVPCCASCCAGCCGSVPCCSGWNGGRDVGRRQQRPRLSTRRLEEGDLRGLKQAPVMADNATSSGATVPGAVLKPGEALALPSSGKHVVSRVFLGIGWRA